MLKKTTLSRERSTAFTQASNDPSIIVKPELFSKESAPVLNLAQPDGIKYHSAPIGSYRVE